MDKDSLVKKCREMVVEGHSRRGRQQKIWVEVYEATSVYSVTWLRIE